MFYIKDLDKELEVQPRFFGPRLREEIERRLRQEVRCLPTARAACTALQPKRDDRRAQQPSMRALLLVHHGLLRFAAAWPSIAPTSICPCRRCVLSAPCSALVAPALRSQHPGLRASDRSKVGLPRTAR